MKILAIGDIHGDSKLTQKLAEQATKENVDYIILTGDLTNFDNFEQGMINNLVKTNKKIMFLPGNHDSPMSEALFSEFYKLKNIHGYGFKTKNDIGIFGCSAVNIGENALDEDEIFELLNKAHDSVKESKIKIMVTHVHPQNSLIDKLGLFEGSASINKAIDKFKPNLLLCSHMHEAKGIEEIIGNTKVVNVAKEAKIIEFD